MTQDNQDGVVTNPQPDILQCEVKWALGSAAVNRASGGDGIPVDLFKTLKDDAIKVLHSICHHIWKTQQWPQDWKSILGQSSSQVPRKAVLKNVQTTGKLLPFPMLARSCSKSCSWASALHELRTFRCSSWIYKRQRNQRSNYQHSLDHRGSKRIKSIFNDFMSMFHHLC